MRLIVEGWRYLPHSYGLVDQGLCLELRRRAAVQLFHRDVRSLYPHLRYDPSLLNDAQAASLLQEIPVPAADQTADVTLRIAVPMNLEPAPAGRTLVFGTAEFGVYDPQQLGRVPIAAMNSKPTVALLTPSQWSRSGMIRSGADPDKVLMIPHGFDPEKFRPVDQQRRAELRKELGWDGGFIFLNVGAMSANKGIVELFKGFAAVAANFPAARLVLKGLDLIYNCKSSLSEYKSVLTAQEREIIEPRLIYLGQTLGMAQTASLYQAADAYVTPYHAEGFNLPVLEAAACGLPIICTGGGPTDEFTESTWALRIASRLQRGHVDGIPGALELSPDVPHLISLMRRAIEDEAWARQARQAAPAFVHARFTWKHVVDQLLAVLDETDCLAWKTRPYIRPIDPRPRPTPPVESATPAWKAYRAGDRAEAKRLADQLLLHEPLQLDAMYLLGVMAMDANRPAEALLHFHHLATLRPDGAVFHGALGETYYALGRIDEAVESLRAAITIDPKLASAHNALGQILFDRGELDAAEASFKAAVTAAPKYERAHLNIGRVYHARGDLDEAQSHILHALQINPNYSTACNALGAIMQARGQPRQAAVHFRKALELNPQYPEAHYNLAAALHAMGDVAHAGAELLEAIKLRPRYARAHALLGQVLVEAGQVASAVTSLQNAVRIKPNDAPTQVMLGDALRLLERGDEALAALDAALRAVPDDPHALAQRFRLQCERCDWRQWHAQQQRLRDIAQQEIAAGRPAPMPPMFAMALPWGPADQLLIARSHARGYARFSSASSPAPWRPRDGRLKIGYLSRDFYDHPVAHQMLGIFGLHDRRRFETHVYSFGPDDGSVYRRRIAAECEHFHDVTALSLSQLDAHIRADGIHILVDLMGYTGMARTACLALRPAPIQVSWLGYAGTMGADFIDYILGDAVLMPAGADRFYSEKIVRLPGSYMPTDHQQPIAERPDRPEDAGLPSGVFVFCCFHNGYKIDPATFALWMKILSQMPASVAWLSVSDPAAQGNLRQHAAEHGVDPARLIFAAHVKSKAEHLARLRLAGCFLDALCYNAHVNACDALWAGVPVITRPGDTFASRVGASLLTAAGLGELIATTEADYERLAVELASNSDRLRDLRAKLAANRPKTPLFDTPAFVRNLERAYDEIALRRESGKDAAAIDLR